MEPDQIRFAADAMLQPLAKWLRLLGYDCLAGDDLYALKLVVRAVEEERWVLSRSRTFHHYVSPVLLRDLRLFPIESESLSGQVRDVVQQFSLNYTEHLFTRCVECNSPLHEVAPHEVAERIPEKTRELHTRFWSCDNCGRVYWHGSHVERSVEKLRRWMAGSPD